jgi:hypothetical protein
VCFYVHAFEYIGGVAHSVERSVRNRQAQGSKPCSSTLFWVSVRSTKKEATPTRFELARAEPSRFLIYLLNHSDTVSWFKKKGGDARIELATSCTRSRNHTNRTITLAYRAKKEATATRFELARAEPSRFRIYLLNHSDTLPVLNTDPQTRVIGLVV